MSAPLRVIDLAAPPDLSAPGAGEAIVVATGDPASPAARYWLQHASFTLTEAPAEDRRVIAVPSVSEALAELTDRVGRWPTAALVCDDVLRAVDTGAPAFTGVVTESLAYSTLQAGPEFRRWLAVRGPATAGHHPEPVAAHRDGDILHIRFNTPGRHNAFSTPARAGLLAALSVAQLDPSVAGVVLGGNGPSFCSGGDLGEFGSFTDPAAAHLARTRHSPALVLDDLSVRLGRGLRAEVHGQVLGSGLEMASFCGRVRAAQRTTFGLPELALGLIPGAGGTVSVTRRIGRWRTAYLVLSGHTVDPATALEWGLVDEIGDVDSGTARCDDATL